MPADRVYQKHAVAREDRPDGSIVLTSGLALGPVARSTGAWLDRWAAEAPGRSFLAERSGTGWRHLTYGEARDRVQGVAAGLLARGIAPGDRVAILSGPGIDHAIVALAAQYIGAVVVPLAEQYSRMPEARGRLAFCLGRAQPALVFARDGDDFAEALAATGVETVVSQGGTGHTLLDDLAATRDDGAVAAAHAGVGPETLGKILFTSGSTSEPKGVPQTHRMMTVNQAQYLAALPVLAERPPVMVDWLPWNHVFGGSSNFHMILANGGTLWIDDGKPVEPLFARSLENLSEVSPTLVCNVPIYLSLLAAAMRKDAALRRRWFAELDLVFYAGAALPAEVWDALVEMSRAETGRVPMVSSSWGMTETAPSAVFHYQGGGAPGMVGVPLPEVTAKLVPVEPGRFDLRVKGSNVFGGYFEDPEKTAAAFDDEGFFITGDAVRFADPGRTEEGLRFDGRLAEDFKLATGIWVQAGMIRPKVLGALEGLVRDVVVTGHDRMSVGLLIFPVAGATSVAPEGGAIHDPAYAAKLLDRLSAFDGAGGASHRIARVLVMAEPPSVAAGEITDKGSLNVRTILTRRADLLARLYDDADPATILVRQAAPTP